MRDNQRRSRARRREYLSELEDKYRNCELLGIEASAEIQRAARHVAEENKQLRVLLRATGLADHEIDAQLATGSPATYAGSTAPVLQTMLHTRTPCCGQKPGTAAPDVLPALYSQTQTGAAGYGLQALQASKSPTPSSDSPLTMTSVGSFNHANPLIMPAMGSTEYVAEDLSPWMNEFPQDVPPYGHPEPSCCDAAAALIVGMNQNVSTSQVKSELGCTALDTNCKVDDSTLFNMMDRYSGDNSWMERQFTQ